MIHPGVIERDDKREIAIALLDSAARLSRIADATFRDAAAASHVTCTEARILLSLHGAEEALSCRAVAANLGLQASTISFAGASLARKGLTHAKRKSGQLDRAFTLSALGTATALTLVGWREGLIAQITAIDPDTCQSITAQLAAVAHLTPAYQDN